MSDALEEPGPGQRLERVADRDAEDRDGRHAGVDVREQGTERHSRPHASPAEQDGGERDARRRPDGRDAARCEGEVESNLGCAEVGPGEEAQPDYVTRLSAGREPSRKLRQYPFSASPPAGPAGFPTLP